MPRYFYWTASQAAPFVSDEDSGFIEALSPHQALHLLTEDYSHPAGLYAARIYTDANAYHEDRTAFLVEYMIPRARARQYGIECPFPGCLGTTTCGVANYGPEVDMHYCHTCGTKWIVNVEDPRRVMDFAEYEAR